MSSFDSERRKLWDEIVASAGGHIFQTSHWMEVAELLGSKPVPFMIGDAVMMAYRSSVFSAKSFGFCLNALRVTRGPCFRNNLFDEAVFSEFVKGLEVYARENHIVLCQINLPQRYGDVVSENVLESFGFSRVLHTSFHTQTYVVNLEGSLEELWNRMEKRTRWSVRKAERLGVDVENGIDRPRVDTFYALYSTTVPNSTIVSFFVKVMEVLGDRGMARVFLAKVGREYVASAFLLMFGKTVFYLWGGNNPSYGRFCPGELLHWNVMKWAKKNGYSFYDLHGAVVEKKDLRIVPKKASTTTLFKRGFGGVPVKYLGEYRKAYSRFVGFRSLGLLRRVANLGARLAIKRGRRT